MKILRKRILAASCLLALCSALFLIYGYFVEPQLLVVNETELRVKGLDPGLSGLRIACISDVHGGSNGADPAKLRRVVAEINTLGPDIVVMLGDYVSRDAKSPSGFLMDPGEVAANLQGITSKYGVFVVMGNHDAGWATEALSRGFEADGYNVLNGKLSILNVNGARLRLLGLKDHQQIGIWKLYSDDARAMLADSEGTGNVIVLQHSPDILPIITGKASISNDLKLMLAAHTHGGQVWLPVVGSPMVPSSYGQKYRAGIIRNAELPMFVTTGIGTSILPFRFMVPPEIALLTLRPE